MKDTILKVIEDAVEELNEDLDYESLEDVNENTVLFDTSEEDSIDSLSLVSLLMDIEKRLKKELGHKVFLADESAMAMSDSPYRSVGALLDFTVARASS